MAHEETDGTRLRGLMGGRHKRTVALAGAVSVVGLLSYALLPLVSRPPAEAPTVNRAPSPTVAIGENTVDQRPAPSPVFPPLEMALALPDIGQGSLPPADERSDSRSQEAIAHVVQEGETLSGIADLYGVSPESIVWANKGVADPHFLSVGQKLIVPPVTGILHTVIDGDTLLAVAALYRAELEAIVEVNALQPPFLIAIGQMLIVPGGKPPEPPKPEPRVVAAAPPQRVEPSSRQGREETQLPAPVPTVVPNPSLTPDAAALVAQLVGPAQRSQRESGVPVSVTIAQAIWESDWGRSGLARKANNYFGIKGRPTPGPAGVIWLDTWEHVNGRNITVKEPFRAYNSLLESVLDHGVFLKSNPRYAEAMKNRSNPRLFIRLVHQAGYATDPAYTDKILRLMDRYNLYVYDAS